MKNNNAIGKSLSFFIPIFLLLSLIILHSGCKKVVPENTGRSPLSNKKLPKGSYPSLHDPELIIYIKPGKTTGDFRNWLDSVKNVDGDIVISRVCGSCDSSLMVLTGPGIATYIQGNAASGGKNVQGQPVTGEYGSLYAGTNINFPLNFFKPSKKQKGPINPFKSVMFTKGSVKVAVFDTGIDTFESRHYLYRPDQFSCIPGAEKGWNFADWNDSFEDDNSIMHGSIVTRLITDQVDQYARNTVEILPVKTHDSSGQSSLFTILCGLAYAQKMGVKIINASFGFYMPHFFAKYQVNPAVVVLKSFIKEYLTKNNILLVAAAGNKDDINERLAFASNTFLPFGMPEYPSDPRNLDEVSFYPASLARDTAFPNVIAVTTVDTLTGTVSPIQNYSHNVVDIGVNADILLKDSLLPLEPHYAFINPRSPYHLPTVDGSSFATPIVTGKLCANYDMIKDIILKPGFTKSDLWVALGSSIVRSTSTLSAKINSGRYMIK